MIKGLNTNANGMPYTRHVTIEPKIFTYENKFFQIKYECPQELGYIKQRALSCEHNLDTIEFVDALSDS